MTLEANRTYRTTEAAAILGIPAETLRTQLKQRWLPVSDDRQSGEWRQISSDELLRCRVALTLASHSIPLRKASAMVACISLTCEHDFIAIAFYESSQYGMGLCNIDTLGGIIDWFRSHGEGSEPKSFLIVDVEQEKRRLMENSKQ